KSFVLYMLINDTYFISYYPLAFFVLTTTMPGFHPCQPWMKSSTLPSTSQMEPLGVRILPHDGGTFSTGRWTCSVSTVRRIESPSRCSVLSTHHCATFTGRHSEPPGMMLLNRSVVGSPSNCRSKVCCTGINRILPLHIAHAKSRHSYDNKRDAHPRPQASYSPNKRRHHDHAKGYDPAYSATRHHW